RFSRDWSSDVCSSDLKSWPDRMAEADAAAYGENTSIFGHLRQRIRGRVNDELRHWIELEAARTEVALLHTHVANAIHFVEILDRSEERRVGKKSITHA